MNTTGSRYLIDCAQSVSEAVELPNGKSMQFFLNPHEKQAQGRVSAQLKAVFSKARRKCEIKTRRMLLEMDEGVWLESGLIVVTALA